MLLRPLLQTGLSSSQVFQKLLLMLLAYFQPIQWLVIAILAFIGIDWLTGIWVSVKRKRCITSIRLRKTIEKLVLYPLALMVVAVFENEFINADWNLPRIVGGYIAATELVSIYENIAFITGQKLFHNLASKLKRKLTEYFKDEDSILK